MSEERKDLLDDYAPKLWAAVDRYEEVLKRDEKEDTTRSAVVVQKPPAGTPLDAVTDAVGLYKERGRIIARLHAWLEKELASREMWSSGLHARSQPIRGMIELEARILKEALENLKHIEATSQP